MIRSIGAVFALIASSTVYANDFTQQDSGGIGRPMIEIGAGYQYQVSEVYNPCPTPCSPGVHSRDTRGSSGTIAVGIEGLRLSDLFSGGVGRYDVRFLPLYMLVDTNRPGYTDSFGRFDGIGNNTAVRRIIGALVQGNYNAAGGLISLRGKLVSIDYNRDRGTLDWRALEATVGIRGAVGTANGDIELNLELAAGTGIGGIRLNNMKEVADAISAHGIEDHSMTINPLMLARASLRVHNFKVEIYNQNERRVDITNRVNSASYAGRGLTVDSWRITTGIDVEYIFGGRRGFDTTGPRLGAFVNGVYEYDTLTFSDMFFNSGDDYHLFRLTAGVRGRF